MIEIIDLSQEIYEGMPVYKDLPQVKMTVHNSHEKWNGLKNPTSKTPAVHKLEFGEHIGKHIDAINHMGIKYKGKSIEKNNESTTMYNRNYGGFDYVRIHAELRA